jgi:hypothetical protein
MAEEKSYEGGCHCGAVRYRVSLAIEQAITCNCSICQKTGTALAFAPAASFTLLRGDDVLTDYQFGRKKLHHLFCSRCGIRSFARGARPDGTPTVAINVRCLDAIDLDAVPKRHFDGRSRPIEG